MPSPLAPFLGYIWEQLPHPIRNDPQMTAM